MVIVIISLTVLAGIIIYLVRDFRRFNKASAGPSGIASETMVEKAAKDWWTGEVDSKKVIYLPKYKDANNGEWLCWSNKGNKYIKSKDPMTEHVVAFRTKKAAEKFISEHKEGDLL